MINYEECGKEVTTFTEAVELVRSGDNRGFDFLYNQTYKDKKFIALKYMKNESDAEDVLQDSYMKALDKLASLSEPEKFPSWLGMIVANTAKNALRAKNPVLFSQLEQENDEGEVVEYEIEDTKINIQPELSYTAQETKELVREMMAGLSDDQRMCVMMFHIEGMSIKQIAETMGCPENTVKSRLNYARKNIKEQGDILQRKGYQLYGLAPFPLLLHLLLLEAGEFGAHQVAAGAGNVAAGAAGAGNVAAGASAGNMGAASGVSSVVTSTGIVSKIIAGTALMAAIGGTAGVIIHNQNDDNRTEAVVEMTTTDEVVISVDNTEAAIDITAEPTNDDKTTAIEAAKEPATEIAIVMPDIVPGTATETTGTEKATTEMPQVNTTEMTTEFQQVNTTETTENTADAATEATTEKNTEASSEETTEAATENTEKLPVYRSEYLKLINNLKNKCDYYSWQYDIDSDDADNIYPIAFCDITGDEIPEMFITSCSSSHSDVATLEIYTVNSSGRAISLYNEEIDDKTFDIGFCIFKTNDGKLYLYNSNTKNDYEIEYSYMGNAASLERQNSIMISGLYDEEEGKIIYDYFYDGDDITSDDFNKRKNAIINNIKDVILYNRNYTDDEAFANKVEAANDLSMTWDDAYAYLSKP